MLVTQDDLADLSQFAKGIAGRLGFDADLPAILWHYTSAAGLLGILESASIYSTQLACLNDFSELRYAICSATALVAGPRQLDGRSLRGVTMA